MGGWGAGSGRLEKKKLLTNEVKAKSPKITEVAFHLMMLEPNWSQRGAAQDKSNHFLLKRLKPK